MVRYAMRVMSLILLVAVALGGTTLVTAQEAPPAFRLLIGTVADNPDQFVALSITEEGEVTIYICDGQVENDTVSVAEWFLGSVVDNTIDITAPSGNQVQVTLDGDTASGTFIFTDGTTKTFDLVLAEDGAGLFRSEITVEDTDYVLGWISFADGTIRGAIRNMSTGDLSPASFKKFDQKREEA